MSIDGTSFATSIILHGDRSQAIQFIALTHPDDDHRRTSEMLGQARTWKFYGGGSPTVETATANKMKIVLPLSRSILTTYWNMLCGVHSGRKSSGNRPHS
jgi:hypothetical protein